MTQFFLTWTIIFWYSIIGQLLSYIQEKQYHDNTKKIDFWRYPYEFKDF